MIHAYNLGDGGLTDHETVKLSEIAQHISSTERTSAEAERKSVDRFTAAYLNDKIGMGIEGRIVRRHPFRIIHQTGFDRSRWPRSDPSPQAMASMTEAHHALIGRRSCGRTFRLGAPVLVHPQSRSINRQPVLDWLAERGAEG